jgi:hypothetical protein
VKLYGIQQEADPDRTGGPHPYITLDHIYEEVTTALSYFEGPAAPAPDVERAERPPTVDELREAAREGGTEDIPSVDVCAFCWDSECDGVCCISNLDPDDLDHHPQLERLQDLLRAGRALLAAPASPVPQAGVGRAERAGVKPSGARPPRRQTVVFPEAPAVRSAAEMLRDRFDTVPCDAPDVASCTAHNARYLAKSVLKALAAPASPVPEVQPDPGEEVER